ncbi:hypothetical protein JCM9140_1999 [Halalkalibacter wakoensis JCM 9140]|uniref:LVIVD repeat-containing protein n=1 Tax=Halalkalibacter wakoensis JCM 9140 TaxID=1236970 RepID=W4Q3P8_9BACI|nr:hypothetical protein [Halalkalibacter wakoensis]GAE25974.1 hypothetical protein JCM9140_1999 [Halalkalibacter wakoensis JCM 9140]
MKKRNLLITTALVGTMTIGGIAPTTLAHDALGSDVNKGERFVFDQDAIEQLSFSLTGSKNVSNFKEAAAVQISLKDGVQNNTADVYAHKGFAYLGTHTANGGNGGVRVFDLKNPSNPVEVAVFADEIPNTWQEKVIVKSVNTPHFKGDLAAVSVQQTSRNNVNRPNSKGGVLLYDVTDPTDPKKLGFYELDRRITGTHELYLTTQGNRALVLTSSPYADYYTHGEQEDFQIIDVTDPTNPEKMWGWDPRELEEIPEDFNGYHWHAPDGKTRPVFNHSVITDNNAQYAYVSMWDLGTVIFDIKDPENPVFLGRTDYRDDQKGAAHSAALARGGTILIETREVSNPVGVGYESAYGYTRIFDIKDKTNPILLSEFTTDLTYQEPFINTFAKTVHDPKVHGNTLYLSYYSGGVVMVDITNPSNPVQIGQYTPEDADVWGVFVDRNYILASDMGQGLKVLTRGQGQGNGNGNGR